jgi:O-antigen ligase
MDCLKGKRLDSDQLLFGAGAGACFCMALGTAPMTIMGAASVAIWLFSGEAWRRRSIYLSHSWFRPVAAMILLPWVGLLYTPDVGGLGINYALKTHYWLYGLALAAIAFDRFPAQRLIQAFMAGVAVNAVAAVLQFSGILPYDNPIANNYGIGPGYSTMSPYLIVCILTASFYFKNTERTNIRWALLLLMGLYFVHLVIMRGRNGYLTFMLVSPLMVANLFRKVNPLKILLVYTLLVGLMLASPAVRREIAWTTEQVRAHLNAPPEKRWGRDYVEKEHRIWIYTNAIRVFLLHPWIGTGTGGFQTVVERLGKPNWPKLRHPHNSFLHMAVSYGIVGVGILGWLFWELFRYAWPQRRTVTGFFVLASTLVLFVSGMFDTQVTNAGMAFLLSVTVGLLEALGPPAEDAGVDQSLPLRR